MGKMKDWFSGLSKAGKTGAIVGGLILVGAANSLATPGGAPSPSPAAQPAVKQAQVEVKEETTTEPIPFTSTTAEDPNIPKDETRITTVGVNGVLTRTYQVTYTNGVETSRSAAVDKITTAPINEVRAIGSYVAPAPRVSSNCDPNYSGGCVPIVSYDLDCPDIGFSVRVIGTDRHGFDGSDNDGYGCESY